MSLPPLLALSIQEYFIYFIFVFFNLAFIIIYNIPCQHASEMVRDEFFQFLY